ncbi:MAG: hypothetical protein ABJB86_03275 [Bacteroidota bacterium]
MKKLIAILLLIIYLFNLAGYSLVFHYLICQSEDKFAAQIDGNKYKDAELLEISIPFNLPYTQNSSEFESLDGSVELNGILYNYVKRRIYNDTLYIMCLSNQQRTQLIKEKSKYAGEVNDFTAGKKEKESSAKKSGPSTEYNNTITQYRFSLPGNTAIQESNNFAVFIPVPAIEISEHPPQFTC